MAQHAIDALRSDLSASGLRRQGTTNGISLYPPVSCLRRGRFCARGNPFDLTDRTPSQQPWAFNPQLSNLRYRSTRHGGGFDDGDAGRSWRTSAGLSAGPKNACGKWSHFSFPIYIYTRVRC